MVNICGIMLNKNCIESVGLVKGDPAWRRYEVVMTSGRSYEFYESRLSEELYMPRERFIQLLGLEEK